MKIPCEIVIWHILPAIRRELTRSLVHDNGITQRNAANILGMTDAAVSQYLSGKRAKLDINNQTVLEDISSLAQRLVEGEDLTTGEICKICTKLRCQQQIIDEFGEFLCQYGDVSSTEDEGTP